MNFGRLEGKLKVNINNINDLGIMKRVLKWYGIFLIVFSLGLTFLLAHKYFRAGDGLLKSCPDCLEAIPWVALFIPVGLAYLYVGSKNALVNPSKEMVFGFIFGIITLTLLGLPLLADLLKLIDLNDFGLPMLFAAVGLATAFISVFLTFIGFRKARKQINLK